MPATIARLTFCAFAFSVLALPAAAQMDHSKMGHGAMAHAKSPADQAFMASMTKMHKNMQQPMTGDADVDFVRGMIPHHEGAVDMANIELQYGKDETLRKLAADIVKAQETEITLMKDWPAKHGK